MHVRNFVDAARSIALAPCGHVCSCEDCACPICRQAIAARLKVFHAWSTMSLVFVTFIAAAACFNLEAYFTNWSVTGNLVADEQTPRSLPLPGDAQRVTVGTADPELRLVKEFSIPVLVTTSPSIGVFMRVKLDPPASADLPRSLVTFSGSSGSVIVAVRRDAVLVNLMECIFLRQGVLLATLDCGQAFDPISDQRVHFLFRRSGSVEVHINGRSPVSTTFSPYTLV